MNVAPSLPLEGNTRSFLEHDVKMCQGNLAESQLVDVGERLH